MELEVKNVMLILYASFTVSTQCYPKYLPIIGILNLVTVQMTALSNVDDQVTQGRCN